MSVADWSTTASTNTSVGGINIAENCPAGNVNNAEREIMAQLRVVMTDAVLSIMGKATVAEIRTALEVTGTTAADTALSALTPAADKLPYFDSSTTASLVTLTSFIRTLLDDPDAASARTTLGAIGVTDASLGANGYVVFALGTFGNLIVNWGTQTSGTNGWSGSYSFPKAYTSSCFGGVATYKALNFGAASGTSIGFQAVSLSQFQIGSEDNPHSAFYIAIGI